MPGKVKKMRAVVPHYFQFPYSTGNSSVRESAITQLLCVKSDIDGLSGLTHNICMSDLARDPRQLGNLIRRARKRQAISQGALGAKAGLRQETISLIENGNSAAKIETILAVLAALDLELCIAPRSKGGLGAESDF